MTNPIDKEKVLENKLQYAKVAITAAPDIEDGAIQEQWRKNSLGVVGPMSLNIIKQARRELAGLAKPSDALEDRQRRFVVRLLTVAPASTNSMLRIGWNLRSKHELPHELIEEVRQDMDKKGKKTTMAAAPVSNTASRSAFIREMLKQDPDVKYRAVEAAWIQVYGRSKDYQELKSSLFYLVKNKMNEEAKGGKKTPGKRGRPAKVADKMVQKGTGMPPVTVQTESDAPFATNNVLRPPLSVKGPTTPYVYVSMEMTIDTLLLQVEEDREMIERLKAVRRLAAARILGERV